MFGKLPAVERMSLFNHDEGLLMLFGVADRLEIGFGIDGDKAQHPRKNHLVIQHQQRQLQETVAIWLRAVDQGKITTLLRVQGILSSHVYQVQGQEKNFSPSVPLM